MGRYRTWSGRTRGCFYPALFEAGITDRLIDASAGIAAGIDLY